MSPPPPRVWLVTGASSGFGRAVTEVILANGDIAVATARSPSSLNDLIARTPPNQLLVIKCDVTIPQDITSAFKSMYAHFGRCDVVFNNAGDSYVAEVENWKQDEMARRMMEVNFWGAANVSREAVRAFRELNPPGKGGLLLTHSSMGGIVSWPGIGYYCASKHALEGLTETLAKEVSPKWNIKISIIESAGYDTRPFKTGSMPMLDAPPAYTDPDMPAQQIRPWFAGGPGPWGDTRKGAERIFKFSKLESPPLRWPMGRPAIEAIREKIQTMEKEISEFESWSEGLELAGGTLLHAKL